MLARRAHLALLLEDAWEEHGGDSGVQSLLRPQAGSRLTAGSFLPPCWDPPSSGSPQPATHIQPRPRCAAHPPCGTGVGLEKKPRTPQSEPPLELLQLPPAED